MMAGLTSMGGPAAMAFVSIHASEIRMDTWRGSVSVLRFTLNFARGIVLFYKRQLDVNNEQVDNFHAFTTFHFRL
jgi:hypothetical protein